MKKASVKLPLIKESIERVAPQEGQGIFKECFIKQASIDGLLVLFCVDT
ncbi:hypothetical protein FGL01_00650 [Flavobacterium glycines]|jgi:hypothetical protein|uniref:Uncharacterized protein n=1 Tax=Flavobacterium glycines TaxID=551990 RepID=A0A511C9I6_9FLAO|nr:hypothetical protein [Flavobacterium glycines]GEL09326.1 hypothetical protein FGL01_00650 [Flavobacterium glycines]